MNNNKPRIKRLFLDIEVSPDTVLIWGPGHQISVGYESIIKERAIICISYKWEGDKKVRHLAWDGSQNDKSMLKKFVKIMDEADELVGHNIDSFDIKWIRGRCWFHDIDMAPSYVTIDTLKELRKLMRLNSNRLDYAAKYIGCGGKTHTSYDMWKVITVNNDRKVLDKMVRYCDNDIVILEKVFQRVKKYIKPKTSLTSKKKHCPECGSHNMVVRQTRISASGYTKKQLQCKDCGKYHTVPASVLK